MKKICSLFLVSVILIGVLSTISSASEVEIKVGDSFFLNGEQVQLVDEDINESYESSEGFNLFAVAGKRYSSTKTYNPWFSANYSISKSEADYQHNTIGVRGRIFDKNGSQLNSKSSTQTHSTIASVTVEDPTNPMKSRTAVGNHTYKRDGFKDTFPETKSSW